MSLSATSCEEATLCTLEERWSFHVTTCSTLDENAGIDGEGACSAAEFICLKLVNRFVSDEISLGTYHDRTAPSELLEVMDNAIAAWNTDVNGRKGHIGTVMQAIIDPQ